MFFFRYIGPKLFITLNGNRFYRKRWFLEQLEDGSYRRNLSFFLNNRLSLMRGDFELKGLKPAIEVMNIGPDIEIGNETFPKNKWITVPIAFDSIKEGHDLFIKYGLKFKSPFLTNSDLRNCQDGDSILILRKYGGLGDILMQSILFPEIRRQFPASRITYAIPRNFMPLFDNCTAIDRVIDCENIISRLPELIVSGEYNFIGDISTSCIEYEIKSLNKLSEGSRSIISTHGSSTKEEIFMSLREGGLKPRPDIWAESLGLALTSYKTCIKLTPDEVRKGKERLNGRSPVPKDPSDIPPSGSGLRRLDRPMARLIEGILSFPKIGFSPYSVAKERSYPYIQELIDGLNEKGYRVFLIHHAEPVEAFQNCEKLINLDLRLLGAVIKNMDIVISADTGILHYAGILGVPVIGIFGVTDGRTRTAYYNATALQGKCDKNSSPCWGRQSAFCRRLDSKSRKDNTSVSSCMYIEPEEIIEKVVDFFSLKFPPQKLY